MKNIIITGGTGFVGQNLMKYLAETNKVESLSVRYVKNQTFNLKADAVVHLAGKAHDLKKVSKPSEYYEANFELTKQLFDAFLMSEASIFVFMSTVKAVADEVNGTLTENFIPNPKTDYGIAKRQAEVYILAQTVPQGKRVYILRPCMIHGPGNKGNLNLLYQLVSKRFPWPLGRFENKRSFLSIENLCFVVSELLENANVPSGIYNVADSETLPTNKLIQLLGDSLGKKSRIVNIPTSWIKKVAKIGDIMYLPLNTERLKKLTENYIVCNNKITIALQKQLPVRAEEGLLQTFESFKNDL